MSLAVVVGLSACSGTSESLSTDLPQKNPTLWVLPLNEFIPNETHVRDYANALVVQDCITAGGFEWPVPWQDIDDPGSISFNGAQRGLFDVALATTWGYHSAPWQGDTADDWREFVAFTSQLIAVQGFEEVYMRCREEGRKELPLPSEETLYFATSVAIELLDKAQSDERVKAAAALWLNCMVPVGVAGLPVSPDLMPTVALEEQFQSGVPGTVASVEEIRVATADAQCRESSGYREVLYETEWDLHVQALQEHTDVLLRVRDELRKQNDRILSVIAAHAPSE